VRHEDLAGRVHDTGSRTALDVISPLRRSFGGSAGRLAQRVTVADVPRDRPEEQIARSIVRHALPNVTVYQQDDGSRDGMVDALITYPDQRTAALEIVSDRDPAYNDVLAALTRQKTVLDAPTLKHSWWITVEDTARIRKLRKEIVRRLEIIEAEPARMSPESSQRAAIRNGTRSSGPPSPRHLRLP
jgi:hypothetical protein